MPRSIWKGAVSFGLVNVPVRVYSATEQKDIRFHEFDKKSGKRIRHKRVAEGTNREVDYEQISKGYEVAKGKYVVVEKEELEAADPEKSRSIEIEDFVDLTEIDPIYYERSYYLGPEKDPGAKKAYMLLHKAMDETGRVAIARFVMRSKEYLATIRPTSDGLVLETMYFPDEIRDQKKTMEEEPGRVKVEKRDLDMARRLIDGLASEWEPSKYKDEHRKRVLEIIERKAEGEEIVLEKGEKAETPPDLMEALRASVEALKKKPASRQRKAASGRKKSARKAS
jgi:DNA end-binding protein Ku